MATLATHHEIDGQFILPVVPASTSPALAALIAEYHVGFVAVSEADSLRWSAAAKLIHDYQPTSLADLAAKLIVAIHYGDPESSPEGSPSALAVEAPERPGDRLAVEMKLRCLSLLMDWAKPDAAHQVEAPRVAQAAMTEQCGRCRFWQLAEDGAPGSVDEERPYGWGWCRRNPPQLSEHVASMTIERPRFGGVGNNDIEDAVSATNVADASLFPATWHDKWCGAFEPIALGARS